MANVQNLKPFTSEQSREKAKINGQKGGIASGKAKREKILLRELLEEALSQKTETGNKYVDISVAVIEKAKSGDTKAYEVIRDTLGQKPIDQVQNINPPQIVIERPKE